MVNRLAALSHMSAQAGGGSEPPRSTGWLPTTHNWTLPAAVRGWTGHIFGYAAGCMKPEYKEPCWDGWVRGWLCYSQFHLDCLPGWGLEGRL